MEESGTQTTRKRTCRGMSGCLPFRARGLMESVHFARNWWRSCKNYTAVERRWQLLTAENSLQPLRYLVHQKRWRKLVRRQRVKRENKRGCRGMSVCLPCGKKDWWSLFILQGIGGDQVSCWKASLKKSIIPFLSIVVIQQTAIRWDKTYNSEHVLCNIYLATSLWRQGLDVRPSFSNYTPNCSLYVRVTKQSAIVDESYISQALL